MKLLPAFLITLFVSCNKSSSFKHSPSDTTKTIAIYYIPGKGIKYSDVYRVDKDSLDWVDKDKKTKVKKWNRSSMYFIPQVDTQKIAGVVKKDSLGNPVLLINYYPIPNQFLLKDMFIDIDSLLNLNSFKQ